eukprot:CAMPEP_0196821360 /NCGR_PEP_ID=MMETSP1362-20130617/78928_1 /TAXON_ID=163516 /ORGANISM="Leptocylindrus danicus, Strain CCMP1856" /LENGTH=662 /DNA_ID=CAMNT_0042200519 /DNA_START=1 /DNA_END=1989 /DNA_ORIENTATION=+
MFAELSNPQQNAMLSSPGMVRNSANNVAIPGEITGQMMIRPNISFQQQAHFSGNVECIQLPVSQNHPLTRVGVQPGVVLPSHVNVNNANNLQNVAAFAYQDISVLPNNSDNVEAAGAISSHSSYAPEHQTIVVQRPVREPVALHYAPAHVGVLNNFLQVPQGCQTVRVLQEPPYILDDVNMGRHEEQYILHQPGLRIVEATPDVAINALPVHQVQMKHLQGTGNVVASYNANVDSGSYITAHRPSLNQCTKTVNDTRSMSKHTDCHASSETDASNSCTKPPARLDAAQESVQTGASSRLAQANASSASLVRDRETSPIVNDDFVCRRVMLGIDGDENTLNDLQCILRKECIEAFSATAADVSRQARRKGGRPIILGQVGVRCVHCKHVQPNQQAQQAVSFPSSLTLIYESLRNWQRFHMERCVHIPESIRAKLRSLKQRGVKPGGSRSVTRLYFAKSAQKIGLVDTPYGIRFADDDLSRYGPHVASSFGVDVDSNTVSVLARSHEEESELVLPEDRSLVTEYIYLLFRQLKSCMFDASRENRRNRDRPNKYPGLACKHCLSVDADERQGRYFPTSVKGLTDPSFSHGVLSHLLKCPGCPASTKNALLTLKRVNAMQIANIKRGLKKDFMDIVWERLHGSPSGSNSTDPGIYQSSERKTCPNE